MITLLAPAKVNLYLRVYGKTNSGLHNLDSIVVFCQFGDKISVSPAGHDSFSMRGPFAPSLTAIDDSENLVIAALRQTRGYPVAADASSASKNDAHHGTPTWWQG